MTVAIHLIWSTYGSWLPGDARGHWSPLFDLYGKLLRDGHRLNVPDATTHAIAKTQMNEAAIELGPADEELVAATLADELASTKVIAHAAAIEPTHVHLLLGNVSLSIGNVAGRLKSRSSSAVKASDAHGQRDRIWSTGYWKVFLFDTEAVGGSARLHRSPQRAASIADASV